MHRETSKRSLRRRFMMQKNRKESLSRTFIRLRRRTFRLQRGESGVGSSSAGRTQSVKFSRPLNNGSLRRTQEGGRTTHSTQNYAKFACVLSANETKFDIDCYRLFGGYCCKSFGRYFLFVYTAMTTIKTNDSRTKEL